MKDTDIAVYKSFLLSHFCDLIKNVHAVSAGLNLIEHLLSKDDIRNKLIAVPMRTSSLRESWSVTILSNCFRFIVYLLRHNQQKTGVDGNCERFLNRLLLLGNKTGQVKAET